MDAKIEDLRQEIDHIDSAILKLLNRRAAISVEVGKNKDRKTRIFSSGREEDIVSNLLAANPGPLPAAHLRAVWREIFSSSRSLQRPQKAAFLGPEGTFSHAAGLGFLGGSTDFTPCHNLRDVFQKVHDNDCDLGIVPLENSLHGSVGQCLDLFMEIEVKILAEFYFRITHSFLSKESELGGIKKIYSHPQALAQCELWLRANMPGVELATVESTARAAVMAAKEPGAAAIGHADLAARHDLNLLARNIADAPDNYTRFMVIGSQGQSDAPSAKAPNADKTSLLFTAADKPGALSAILNLLAEENINISKLESRPQKGRQWKYIFFADIDCDLDTPAHRHIIDSLEGICGSLRILGGYARGRVING